MDFIPPASSVHGISQARILEWVAISFSRESSQLRNGNCVSCIGRQILYHWVTREALNNINHYIITWCYNVIKLVYTMHNNLLYTIYLNQSESVSHSVVSNSLWPHGLSLPGSQAPLFKGFPRQEYWSGLPFPPLGNFPDPGIKPTSPELAGRFFTKSFLSQVIQSSSQPVSLFGPSLVLLPSSLKKGLANLKMSSGGVACPPKCLLIIA